MASLHSTTFDAGPSEYTFYLDTAQPESSVDRVWTEIRYDPTKGPFVVPIHWHAKHVEKFLVLEGKLEAIIDGKSIIVTPETGELSVPTYVLHGFKDIPGEPFVLVEKVEPVAYAMEKLAFFKELSEILGGLRGAKPDTRTFLALMRLNADGDSYLPLPGGIKALEWMKRRQRKRLRMVDSVVHTLDSSLHALYDTLAATKPALLSMRHKFPTTGVIRTSSPFAPSIESRTAAGRYGTAGTVDSATMRAAGTSTETEAAIGGKIGLGDAHEDHGSSVERGGLQEKFEGVGNDAGGATTKRKLKTIKNIERWKAEMPREDEMPAKDKYTIFDRKEKKYRKGIHKLPKWTRVSQRINPAGF